MGSSGEDAGGGAASASTAVLNASGGVTVVSGDGIQGITIFTCGASPGLWIDKSLLLFMRKIVVTCGEADRSSRGKLSFFFFSRSSKKGPKQA